MKKLLMAFVIVMAFLALSKDINAQSQNFSMTNNTDLILIDVFISPNDENNWGSDVIPKDMILPGETFDFSFTGVDPSKCVWDIMFTADDGVKYYMQDVDLCNLTSITLSKD
jgi:hypothetical protein